MKTTKQFMMICCLMVMVATGYAQQWEIDFEGIGNYSPLRTGIINDKGEAVIMGECGTDNSHYYPMIMRVTPDGEYDYRDDSQKPAQIRTLFFLTGLGVLV